MLVICTTKARMCSKREPFDALLPLLRHVVPLNDGNCRLTIPVVKGRCAPDTLPHAFHIGVFEFVQTISTAIKHIYKESANIIADCNVAFDTNNCWNFQSTVPVIVIESMVTRTRPSYKRAFLTPGICSQLSPLRWKTDVIFHQNPHSHVIICPNALVPFTPRPFHLKFQWRKWLNDSRKRKLTHCGRVVNTNLWIESSLV